MKPYQEWLKDFKDQDTLDRGQQDYESATQNIPTAQFAAGMGAALAGKGPESAANYFQGQREAAAKTRDLGSANRSEMVKAYLASQKAEEAAAEKKSEFGQSLEQRKSEGDWKKVMAQDIAARRGDKEKELSSTQAKQLGLAEMGNLANIQYEKALETGYDPTSYANKLDTITWMPEFTKSKEGRAAVNAQTAWIESYLRDASGAAIAPSERLAYAETYFARPGDTPEVVANKEALRKQKEKIALLGAGPGSSKFTPQISSEKKIQTPTNIETKTYQGKTYQLLGGNRKDPKSWKVVGE